MIEIKEGMKLPCDVVIVSGKVVVDESSLTGESIPVIKNELPRMSEHDELFNVQTNNNNILFSGTTVLQLTNTSSGSVHALVFGTAFDTAKGGLIKSILNPKPTKFKFYRDSLRFILFLLSFGLLGFIYNLILTTKYGDAAFTSIISGLDMVTIIVPPTLPVAITIGTGISLARLQKSNIFCIEPTR